MIDEKEKKQNGELYDPTASQLVEERARARRLTYEYNHTTVDETETRWRLLRELFGTVDRSAHVNPAFRCDYGYNIHVGENFFANYDCVILDAAPVEIGANCLIAPGVHIYTPTHPLDPDKRIEGKEYAKAVTIGDNVWIGGHATVNPGVTVGDNVVIGSGSVVSEDVPDRVLVQGNPAEVVKEFD